MGEKQIQTASHSLWQVSENHLLAAVKFIKEEREGQREREREGEMGFNCLLEAVFLLHRDRLEESSNPSIDPSERMATGSTCITVFMFETESVCAGLSRALLT